MVRAETEKTSKRDIDVQDAAAYFLDDQPLDCADVIIVRIINRSAFYPITLDYRLRLKTVESRRLFCPRGKSRSQRRPRWRLPC